jgi:hypothetical protein
MQGKGLFCTLRKKKAIYNPNKFSFWIKLENEGANLEN